LAGGGHQEALSMKVKQLYAKPVVSKILGSFSVLKKLITPFPFF
jgi:hypothetical protein